MSGRERILMLAQRVSVGDPAATLQFLDEIVPRMNHIVRRVVRAQSPRTALAAQILCEARRTANEPGADEPDSERVIAQVARAICTGVVKQVREAPGSCAAICDTILA